MGAPIRRRRSSGADLPAGAVAGDALGRGDLCDVRYHLAGGGAVR
jgi:hypothetical protein